MHARLTRRAPAVLSACLLVAAAGALQAQTRGTAAAPPLPKRTVTDVTCAASLGVGIKTARKFCDVVVATTGGESVSMAIPAHAGTALLTFDLHNRFDVSTRVLQPVLFARHLARVAVLRQTGAIIAEAAAAGEFRVAADAFDRVPGGTAPGALKAVAPGPPNAVRVTIPAGVTSIGIVGVRLSAMGSTGTTEVLEAPGRPVAIVSNLKIEYTPTR